MDKLNVISIYDMPSNLNGKIGNFAMNTSRTLGCKYLKFISILGKKLGGEDWDSIMSYMNPLSSLI